MEYKKTLNMNKSGFPMRASLPQREPAMLEHWYEMDLYHELLKKNDGKPLFALHDGPPFSNGGLHMGHALNKSLKDFMIRSAAMRGYYTPYIPGWDNHGMPIESAIIKKNKLNHKAMPIPEFRSACHDFAQHYIDVQREGFKRLGVVGDWDHPYMTMDKGFEAEEVKVFGEMFKKGYIYKGLKPVYWCPKDETALAEAEIEYQDDPCTTVYVKFKMHDDLGKLPNLDHDKLFFVIWTTTIWTLPGNLAICLNPKETYVVVKAPNGECYRHGRGADARRSCSIGGFDSYEIVERHEGAFFENMLADHPFLPKTSRLVLADYVTMDSGTGCVHTAPGFGADDYQTCQPLRHGADRSGGRPGPPHRLRRQVCRYEDRRIQPRDPCGHEAVRRAVCLGGDRSLLSALLALQESDHLPRDAAVVLLGRVVQGRRLRTPVTTCSWVPGWGMDRMMAMIRERADWCISRQRRWGLPIPVFYCKDCGKPICNDETIDAVSALFGEGRLQRLV